MKLPSLEKLETVSAAKLIKIKERLEREDTRLMDLLIAEGRGEELRSAVWQKDDALSLACRVVYEALGKVGDEERARRRWHGGLKPIKRKS